jgi:hypothetical protein
MLHRSVYKQTSYIQSTNEVTWEHSLWAAVHSVGGHSNYETALYFIGANLIRTMLSMLSL